MDVLTTTLVVVMVMYQYLLLVYKEFEHPIDKSKWLMHSNAYYEVSLPNVYAIYSNKILNKTPICNGYNQTQDKKKWKTYS